ncbi:MAG: hypothetical protein WCB12_01235 [Bryobacteraceae bacterium]
MAKRPVPSVAADLADVLLFLTERGIVPVQPSARLAEHAKLIHRATYSLILWRFRLSGLPEHAQAFIEEIASDALQILPQVLMGCTKTAKLLVRGIIENTLRHIYFSDHPVEFARMNRDRKWHVRMDDLFEYALAHPDFIKTEPKFDAINRVTTLYSELSGGIHGRTVRDLEMRVALEKIAYDEQSSGKQVVLVERCAEACNFMLAVFRREQFARFEREDRRIILRTMPLGPRRILSEFE